MYFPNPPASPHESDLAKLIANARRHWEARRLLGTSTAAPEHGTGPPRFTIALSREAGTLGTSVAQEVGRQLGWPVYDHDLLEHIAQEMGLRTELLRSVDEREQNWLVEAVQAFASSPAKSDWGPLVSEAGYVHYLIQSVLALGTHGECVIVGRGAAFILPLATTLRVRLVAPVCDRVAALSRRLGVSEREAAQQVRTLDRQRTDFVRDQFAKDPNDPACYDLILNAGRLSLTDCAALIVDTLHRLQRAAATLP